MTIEVVSAEALPLCLDDKATENASGSQLHAFVEVKVDGKRVVATEVLKNISCPEWNEQLEEINLDKENKEIAFFVKHEAVGGQGEVLARCVFQIPDLVAACKNGDGEQMECRLRQELDPQGVLVLNITLEEETEDVLDRMKNMARVEVIHPVKGHRFAIANLVMPRPCGFCGEWLGGIGRAALSCKECTMTVHKNCLNSVLVACQGKTVPYKEGDIQIQANIPHSLVLTNFKQPTWCSHCGGFLWGGFKQGLQCTAKNCAFVCHRRCQEYAGTFCGTDQRVLAGILASIEEKIKTYEIDQREKRASTIRGCATPSEPLTLKDFKLKATLGRGAFGKVFLAERIKTKTICAIKAVEKEVIIENDDIDITMLERDVLALGSKQCRFLTGLHASFQDPERLFFVMDFLGGGDLMHHMMQSKRFGEARARFYTAEIVLALLFLHNEEIIYRDLKLDNVLLTSEGHIKLADFGMCKRGMLNGLTNTFCGTPNYIAPEIITMKPYSYPVDWWALGILLYEMMTGRSPFQSQNENELFRKIEKDPVSFKGLNKNLIISNEAKQIITALLVKEPKDRLGTVREGEDGKDDHQGLKSNNFFKGVDWKGLEEGSVTPPFVPAVGSETDTRNFDKEFTTQPPVLDTTGKIDPKIAEQCRDNFKGFSFCAK